MATCVDREGNCHSNSTVEALERYDAFLLSYAQFSTKVLDALEDVFTAEPNLPMAHCARSYLHLAAGKRELLPIAEAALAALDSSNQTLNAWETAHREAVRAWLRADTVRSRLLWDELLIEHPRDFVAIKMTQFGHFYAGARERMRDAVNRVLRDWSPDAPLYGYVLGMQAFGFEECHDYLHAEAAGRAAIDRNRDDVWAVHAVAHCMEMRDRAAEGIRWLSHCIAATPSTALDNHLQWHKALMQIANGEAEAALADYDVGLYGNSVEYLDICNDVALLARLEVSGIDVGSRWQQLMPRVAARKNDQLMVFCDAHYVLAAAAANDQPVLQQLLDNMHRHSCDATSDGIVVSHVGLTLCNALAARATHDHRNTAELLNAVREDLHQIGGSNAQRDLFEQLLIDAHLRTGDSRGAAGLLAQRIRQRPENETARALLARCSHEMSAN